MAKRPGEEDYQMPLAQVRIEISKQVLAAFDRTMRYNGIAINKRDLVKAFQLWLTSFVDEEGFGDDIRAGLENMGPEGLLPGVEFKVLEKGDEEDEW